MSWILSCIAWCYLELQPNKSNASCISKHCVTFSCILLKWIPILNVFHVIFPPGLCCHLYVAVFCAKLCRNQRIMSLVGRRQLSQAATDISCPAFLIMLEMTNLIFKIRKRNWVCVHWRGLHFKRRATCVYDIPTMTIPTVYNKQLIYRALPTQDWFLEPILLLNFCFDFAICWHLFVKMVLVQELFCYHFFKYKK